MSVMSRDIKEIAYLVEIGWFEPNQAVPFKPKEVIGGVTRGVVAVMSRDIKEIAYLEEIGWFEPAQAEQFKPKEVIRGVTRGAWCL